ncbi:MAG: DUF2252 domain-containing protein [Acidimicrobiia bacterium]|nr:DUF2252 domain-containing protein [Acidimicrobiia bacterium]
MGSKDWTTPSVGSANGVVSLLARSEPTVSRGRRRARGKAARSQARRSELGRWAPGPDRVDPVALLDAQNANRFPDLVPVRWGRMVASPFAFFRGSAAVMAADLATSPVSGLVTQVCGDAHLQNFGLFASPERRLLFDLNDFDETLPGPWEWDVKRLATSIVLAMRANGVDGARQRTAAESCARSYRESMASYATMSSTEVWYSKVDVDDSLTEMVGGSRLRLERVAERARQRTTMHALARLTAVVDGERRIVDDPPIVEHLPQTMDTYDVRAMVDEYRTTLTEERRYLFDRFGIIDIARKVVGVGSVGTHCWIALAVADSEQDDPLFLQVKEATRSVLEPFVGRSAHRHHGERVVVGQRMMQAASDLFLGWMSSNEGRDYYVRQLRDMKGSVRTEVMSVGDLTNYGNRCASVLARAHARSGDPVALAGYLGRGATFDGAVAAYARAYADQAERDHAELRRAIDSGRVPAIEGV